MARGANTVRKIAIQITFIRLSPTIYLPTSPTIWSFKLDFWNIMVSE